MSDVKKELDNIKRIRGELSDAFKAAASAIEKEMPDVWREAMETWQDVEDAARYLCTPKRQLVGRTPADVAMGLPEGRQQVLDELGRIK